MAGAFSRATAARESSHFKEIIKTRTGEREEIHKKTFTKWMNAKLSKASPPIQISHLIEDLQDGLALLLLLEVLVPGLILPKEKGKLRIHKMNNVTRAFEVLEKHGVKLVGINNSDIVDSKTTPILGLIWSIILRFQVQDIMQQDTGGSGVKDFHVEKRLLGWCSQSLEGYEHVVKLKDFTASWRNGLAFNAIIHSHKPELFEFEDLRQNDNRTNLEHAFAVANENLSVPRLLEPEDIDVDQPDKKLIIMYLTSLYDGLRGYVPQGKRRKLEHLAEVEAYRSCHGDVMLYISQVERDIASKLDSSNRFDTPNEEYKKSKELINDIAEHKDRVQEVLERGSALIKGRRLTDVEAKEINDQLVTLQDRWEKLCFLAERLNKRCHGTLIGPKEQKLDDQLAWILQARENLAREDVPTSPRDLPLKTRMSELKAFIGEIDKKQPEIDQTADEVGRLCADGALDEEDSILLRNKLQKVSTNWEELRREAQEKQMSAPEYDEPLHGAKRLRLAEKDLIQIEDGGAVTVEGAPGPRLQEDHISPYMFKPIVVNLDMDDGDSSTSTRSTPPHPHVKEMVQAVNDQGVVEATPDGGYALHSHRATPEKEKRKRDKLLKWKLNRKKLLDAVKDCELKMQNAKSKETEEDPQKVKDVLEECDREVKGVESEMRFVFEYGNDLMADEDFDEEERENIMSDLEHVIQEYNSLKEELERELGHSRRTVRKWRKDCIELDNKLSDFQDILNGMKNKEIPGDPERFAGYTAEVAEFTDEIQALEPQFVQVMNDGNQLLRNEALNEPEKAQIYAELQEIERKYEGVKDDISQELNRLEEIDKKEELDTWNKCKKNLEDQFDKVCDQLKLLKDHEQPNDLKRAEELLALSKECSKSLESTEPEVRSTLDYSRQVLGDDLLNTDEKRCIQEDVDRLKSSRDELKRDVAEMHERLENRVADLHREKTSKLNHWDDIKTKAVTSIDRCRTKFEQEKSKASPQNPKEILEGLEAIKECSADLQLTFPEVKAGYEYGNTLLEDDNLDPTSKENIKKDMETVGSDFQNLQKSIENERKSLEELQEECDKEIQNREKMDEWRDEKNKLNSLLKKCRVKHNQLRGLDTSGNPTKVTEKLERLKSFNSEIREVSPVLETGLEFGETLMADPLLREDDKGFVSDDVTKIRGGFESLKAEVFDEQNRLEELAQEQEKAKKDKLDKWNKSNENAKQIINKLQEKVLALKSNDIPQSCSELEARAECVKDCEKEVECRRPELNTTLDNGKELIHDSILDDSERGQVKDDVDQLERQLSDIEKRMADEQGRLELATLQQAKEKQEKLDRWEKWKEKIKDNMGNCRNKLEPVEAKDWPRTRKSLQEDLARVQECEEGLVSSAAELDFGLDYGGQLLDDHVLTDQDKPTVRLEIDQLKFELDELKRRISYEKDRINMETERQDAESRDKLDEWDEGKMEMRALLDKLRDKFNSMDGEEPRNRAEVDEQMIEMKECVDELQSTEPEVRIYLDKGCQLLNNDDTLSEEAKDDIKRDIDRTEDELKSMARQIEDRQLHLQGVMDNLAEEEEVMGEWRERARLVRYGLAVADNMVAHGETDPPQSKTQLDDRLRQIQSINQGFVENEGDFQSTLRLGRELVNDEALSEESIEEVKADILFMDDNWHKLKEQCLEEEKRLGAALQLYNARADEVDTWHQQCDDLQHWINNKLEALKTRSLSPVPSFGNVKRQQSVNEDLVSGLLERQGMINALIDDGNNFINDNSIPMDDRQTIHDKMSKVHDDWDELSDLVQERQRIAIDQRLKLEQAHQDEVEGWRKRVNRIIKWISEAEPKINNQFAIAPDLDTVKKQRESIQLFTTEMLSHQREVSGLLQEGDHLAKDGDFGEDERAAISKENLDFGHRWEELEELITWKQNRLEDTIIKLKKQQHDKLAKWEEGLQDVSGWVEKMVPVIEPEPVLASDVDSAYQQLEEMQYTVNEAPLYQEKVNSLNEFSSNLMADPCLGEEERVKLRRETVQCNNKWNEFVNIANARQARLDQNIDRLEGEQNASLDQWKAKYTRSSNLLDHFEAGIPILDQPVGNKMEDVTRQGEHFEAFSDEVDANETHMNETCKLGERIKNEKAFSQNARDTVEGQLNLVRVRWDRVKDFLVLRKGRLKEASKRLGRDREDKLLNWEGKRDEIDEMMDRAEREVEMQEVIEDDLPTIRKQSEELQEAIGEMMDNQQKVVEFGKHSDDLMSDNCLDNSSKETIQKEKELLTQRWNAIVDKTNKNQERMQERLRDLEVGQAGMSRWLDQLIILQEKVDKLHQVCDSDLGPNYEAMLLQKKETEDAILESHALEPQMAEFVDQSDALKSGPGLNANQQDKITRKTRELNKRWEDLANSLNSRQSSIDVVFKDLEKEQQRLLDEWTSLSGNTRKWLRDTAARVQAQDSPTPDLDHARAQKQEMEDLFGEIRQYEPNIDALDDVGAKLLKNPSLRGTERQEVANERAAIMRDWDQLNSDALNMQSKLDDKVEVLERDQREKLKVWEDKTDPLEAWLNETEAEVESYEPIGFDLENIRAQRDQAQNMINELLQEQPRFATVRDYGNKLTREPCVGLEERMVLQERMQSLNEKWDDVYGKVTKRHDRILEVLKPMEEEQRRRQEEEERLRREAEEKKRREEKERWRREEEEERRRKEEEERKRLEEEERKRREEDERASKEELMALMMDFQPHVEKLEKERQVFASPDETTLVPVVDDVVESSQVSFVKSDPFAEAQERTHERVVEWREKVGGVNRWLNSHRSKLDDESDDEDLVGLREHLKLTEGMERELPVYQALYEDSCAVYSQLLDDPYIAEDNLKAVEDDMSGLRDNWERTIRKREKKLDRLDGKIRSKEDELADEMEKGETKINQTKEWIEGKLAEIDSLGPVGDDMKTIAQQKAKLKDISQEIVDFEPTFVEHTEACYSVSRDVALTPDESHQLQCCGEECEDRWDDLNESVRKKVDEILARTTELRQHEQGILQDWSDKQETFEAKIKNCEDKYKKNTPQGHDAVAMGLENSEGEVASESNGNVEWKTAIDGGQDKLHRARKSLVDIRNRKKNRKWSLIDTIKGAVSSIGKRLRRATQPQGIDLDLVVEQVEKHEELMRLNSELQKPASDVFAAGDSICSSPAMDEEKKESVGADLAALRTRWNAVNERSVSRADRLENLAQQIESEYEKFDSWHNKCSSLNQWLSESERLIKQEEKASTDVETVKYQIQDNKDFLNEVRNYQPQADEFFEESRDLMESSRLDKTDVEGIEKTRDTLRTRWNAVNEHLRDRQSRLEGMLLVLQKKNTEDTLGRWKNQSSQLKLWLSSSEDKLNRGNLDETDFGAIEEYATQVEDVESALESSYNSELNLLTDSGFEILKKEGLNSSEQGEVTEELNSLNQHIGKLESSARLKKGKIRDASAKHFDHNLFELEGSMDELEREAKENFSFVGSGIMEVTKQLADIQNFEKELSEERVRFAEDKEKFEDCKRKNLLNDDDREKLERRFDQLDKRWEDLEHSHVDNRKRNVQALIVLHEELMEEIYDWMEETEKQLDSIQVDENNVISLKEEFGQIKELQEDISSFEPQFRNAMAMSDRMITAQYVDPERVESYEKEAASLEERMERIKLKFMDKSQRLSSGVAKHLTSRLDDGEILLTNTEGQIHQEDEGYVDLEFAKQQLDSQKDFMIEVSKTQREVSIILDEASVTVEDGYFGDPEEAHFRGRIDEIEKRTIAVGENASKEHKRVFDTYLLLLKQHLNRINDWLSRAEARMNTEEEIGTQYENVKQQLEDHQAFQDELRDHSLIATILELDITDPMINQNVRDQVKSMSERWAAVWNWAEQLHNQLTAVITNWQKFRDEQLILLNWLASKEKQLKEIGETNLSDQSEVQEHLQSLRGVEKELDEQGIRLQSLHKAGDDLLKNMDKDEPASREVRTQLKDFDDCWNDIAKQVIVRIQSLETSENKLREYREELGAVEEWMDGTESLVKGFTVDMDPQEATALQEKVEIKCEEKPKYRLRVDRVNRLGKDLAGSVDKPSYETIQEELKPFNQRWDSISEQLDIYSDKGYPQQDRACCFVRIMRQKFGVFQ